MLAVTISVDLQRRAVQLQINTDGTNQHQNGLLGAADLKVVVSARRLCTSSLEISEVLHVWNSLRSVWCMRVYYGVGGWVGQVYIISLAPHPWGQQQKMPFTTAVRGTSVPARFNIYRFTPTPTPNS